MAPQSNLLSGSTGAFPNIDRLLASRDRLQRLQQLHNQHHSITGPHNPSQNPPHHAPPTRPQPPPIPAGTTCHPSNPAYPTAELRGVSGVPPQVADPPEQPGGSPEDPSPRVLASRGQGVPPHQASLDRLLRFHVAKATSEAFGCLRPLPGEASDTPSGSSTPELPRPASPGDLGGVEGKPLERGPREGSGEVLSAIAGCRSGGGVRPDQSEARTQYEAFRTERRRRATAAVVIQACVRGCLARREAAAERRAADFRRRCACRVLAVVLREWSYAAGARANMR